MPKTTRIAGAAVAGALLLGASAAGAAAAQPARPGQPPSGPERLNTCSLAGARITASASVDTQRTDLFARYGNSGEGWTGGDSTYSVQLRDGSLAWIFSDTFLGPVHEDGSRPESTPFLNNSIIVEDGQDLATVTGGSEENPESIVGPGADSDWSWFGAGLRTRTGGLQVGVLEFARFGDGYWDWGWSSNSLATIDTDSWELVDVQPLPSDGNVQWASWYQRVNGHVYVYGVEDLGAEKYLHVAKVLGGDLTDLNRWRYWDGASWQTDETTSTRVLKDVANEYSVTPYRDGYLLVTQDTSAPFSSEIRAYTSCSPVGPFINPTTVYHMPEVGPMGTYGNPNVIAYNAHEHPELRDGDTLLVTYNVNSMDPSDLYNDVSIYRPRFIEVELDVTTP